MRRVGIIVLLTMFGLWNVVWGQAGSKFSQNARVDDQARSMMTIASGSLLSGLKVIAPGTVANVGVVLTTNSAPTGGVYLTQVSGSGFIGAASTVVSGTGATAGYMLSAGQSVNVPINNANKIFVNTTSDGTAGIAQVEWLLTY